MEEYKTYKEMNGLYLVEVHCMGGLSQYFGVYDDPNKMREDQMKYMQGKKVSLYKFVIQEIYLNQRSEKL